MHGRRSQLTLGLLCSAALCTVYWVTFQHSATTAAGTSRRFREPLADIMARAGQWTVEREAALRGDLAAVQSCDPYELRGVLSLNQTYWPNSEWIPFYEDEKCRPINWILHARNEIDGISSSDAPDLSWMQDKTITFFSDSIDRMLVEDACRFLGSEHELINATHSASPVIPQHFWDEDMAPKDHDYNNGHGHGRPTMCHVPHFNFTLLSVYHFGLGEPEEMRDAGFLADQHYSPPAKAIDRYQYIVLPLLKNLGRGLDLFQFNSYAWSVHFIWYKERNRHGYMPDLVNKVDTHKFRTRLQKALIQLADLLPATTAFVYRAPHEIGSGKQTVLPRVGVALAEQTYSVIEMLTGRKWDLSDMPQDALALERQAKRKAPLRNRLRVSGTGRLTTGYTHWYRDAVHPGIELNYIAANVAMSELKRAVSTRESAVMLG